MMTRPLPTLAAFMLFAGCASTYEGPEILAAERYQATLDGETLQPVNVVYKRFNESGSAFSVEDKNKAAELFQESQIFSEVGFGEEAMPVQMHVSYRQTGHYNLVQDVFIGATLGLIPQKVKYTIELRIDTFVRDNKIASHRYLLEKVIQGSSLDTAELENLEHDALAILLDRFFTELIRDADLRRQLILTAEINRGGPEHRSNVPGQAEVEEG